MREGSTPCGRGWRSCWCSSGCRCLAWSSRSDDPARREHPSTAASDRAGVIAAAIVGGPDVDGHTSVLRLSARNPCSRALIQDWRTFSESWTSILDRHAYPQ